ncbi:MAG: hypothetical protein V8Q79_01905 [Christensenellales bacterium]
METACGGTGRKGGIEETRMRIHPPVFGDDFSMRVLIWSYTAGLRETAGLGDLHIHGRLYGVHGILPLSRISFMIPGVLYPASRTAGTCGSLNKHKQT